MVRQIVLKAHTASEEPSQNLTRREHITSMSECGEPRKHRSQMSRVIVSCSVGGLSLTQGDEHGEGFEEEP